jgi:16S rRNA (cytidine1402-2'-O)-methyltransferase
VATLYVVSTPIGNLEDLSPRAGRVLGEVTRILAEDTRRTAGLLRHLDRSTPLVSYHAHNEASRTEEALTWLDAGEDLALVSDAGTPGVSDPGARLVAAAGEAGHAVVPVPGASALTAALAASGFSATPALFLGFMPRSGSERTRVLERIASSGETAVLFESPERLARLLRDLAEACGPDRRVAVCRELTKVHEETVRGTLPEVGRYYEDGGVRGEVTLVVAPAADPGPTGERIDEAAGRALARALLDEGMSPSRAARDVARRLGIPRNAAYQLVHEESHG